MGSQTLVIKMMKTDAQLREAYERKLECDRKRIKIWKKEHPKLVKAQHARRRAKYRTGNPVGRPKDAVYGTFELASEEINEILRVGCHQGLEGVPGA